MVSGRLSLISQMSNILFLEIVTIGQINVF